MQIKATVKFHLIPVRMGFNKKSAKKKSLQIINAREGMEKKQPSYAAGGNVKHYSHYGEQLKKTKNRNNMFQQSHS